MRKKSKNVILRFGMSINTVCPQLIGYHTVRTCFLLSLLIGRWYVLPLPVRMHQSV